MPSCFFPYLDQFMLLLMVVVVCVVHGSEGADVHSWAYM